jgi:hypothetical protein
MSYFEFGFESGVGTYGCECQCKYQHLAANIFVNSYSCSARKDVQAALGSHCQFNGCWQSKKVDSVAKLDPLSFCKIVIRGSQYNCFTPLLCGTCKVDGAFFGVWGKLRSNPYVSAKNSVYQCS